jgi:hypothetical protein
MGLEDVPRCQHVKVNGVQCGSPALRRRQRCYFHDRMTDGKNRFVAASSVKPRPLFSMCLLEDANAVQVALMQVLTMLGSGQIDPKTAGLMLYGLQTASCNLRHTTFEAQKATDVVIDPKSVGRTCLNDPQWFAHDFADAEGAKNESEPSRVAAASSEPVQVEVQDGEVSQQKACPAKAAVAKPGTDNRKRPERAEREGPPSTVRDLLFRLLPNMTPPGSQSRTGITG